MIFFLFNSLFFNSAAQINRVSNGNFEEYDSCPTFFGQPSVQQIPRCKGWFAPTNGSSDYFNTCAPLSSQVNVPYNFADYQQPYGGNGYAGFFVLEDYNYREYIQTKLNRPMIEGHQYEIRFRVSMAKMASNRSVSSIGVFLSNYQIQDYSIESNLNVIPQIENPVGNYLTDSVGWMLISGVYSAVGSENYITIGNFRDSIDTDADPPGYRTAYYFIDDVEVISLSEEQLLPNVFSPNGDGINDVIDFSNFGLEKVACKIYNRWGSTVAQINDINDYWDGTNCEDGVYYYILKGTEENKTEFFQKGFIQLLR